MAGSGGRRFFVFLFSWRGFAIDAIISGAGRAKAVDAEFAGAMRIDQFGRADIGIADKIGKARDSELQFFRDRARLGTKRPPCAERGCAGSALMVTFSIGAARRIRLQVQAQQFQEHFGVAHGDRKAERFFVRLRRWLLVRGLARIVFQALNAIFEGRFELEAHANGLNGERAGIQARAELIEQTAEDERERLEFLNRIVKSHFLFESEAGLREHERAHVGAASEFVQANALLAEAFG